VVDCWGVDACAPAVACAGEDPVTGIVTDLLILIVLEIESERSREGLVESSSVEPTGNEGM